MKTRVYLILLILGCFYSQSNAQFFPIDTFKLNNAYRELINNSNTLDRQKKFFDLFPSTWMEYIMTYQYVPNDKYDLSMYNIAEEHVSALGNRVTLIPDTIYCSKLINISINAFYDADAPNYLKALLHTKMWDLNKADVFFQILKKLSKADQIKFWQFYWSSENPKPKSEYDRLYKLMADVYPEEIKLMKVGFENFNGQSEFSVNYPYLEKEYMKNKHTH